MTDTAGGHWLSRELGRAPSALVTGGSTGLGLALARELLAHGFAVFICARTQADLDAATAAEPRFHPIRADVAKAEDRERLMAAIMAATGGVPLDLLVNNAAIVRAHDYTNPFTLKEDRAAAEIAINLAAPIELARLFLLSRLGGPDAPAAILNVSTPGAFFPLDANPLYCATKSALHMFTLSLRRHLAETPVRVFEVFPPALDTRLADQLDVPSQTANGQEAVDAVAKATVSGLLEGVETILPHEQSKALVELFPPLDMKLINALNKGVARRSGWDRD